MKVGIVGSGISGLGTAHILGPHHDVTLFERDARLGGHTNTVVVDDPKAGPIGVDTGFIVHNVRNYPNLTKLFGELGVKTQDSEMSFGVSDAASGITYSATGLNSLFAQRRNIVRSDLWKMLYDIGRFYRHGQRVLEADPNPEYTVGQFLADGGYGTTFTNLHLIPMGAAVWSSDPTSFLDFPAATLLRFLDNHGLLRWNDKPLWLTVTGGSHRYIEAIVDRFSGAVRVGCPITAVTRTDDGHVEVRTDSGVERFDHVVLACHSDQSLKLLTNPTSTEADALASVKYQPNTATLHTDTSVLPPERNAWAAWNYRRPSQRPSEQAGPAVTYDLTNLQRLQGSRRYLVSLNSVDQIDPDRTLAQFSYAHPVFTTAAIQAQAAIVETNSSDRISFAGAWLRYGFHEDGLLSAVNVARSLGVAW